jgi:multisubunit Na+/H+ antiporter MnhC subunit
MTRRAIRVFSFNKKGASPVISTLILTAGVIAMSIAVLYWTMGKIKY